jgi:capsule polysaccharide export protein KpsE/RkpR
MSSFTFAFRLIEGTYGTYGPQIEVTIDRDGEIEGLDIKGVEGLESDYSAFVWMFGGEKIIRQLVDRARAEMEGECDDDDRYRAERLERAREKIRRELEAGKS